MIVIKRKYIRLAERLAITLAVVAVTAVAVKAFDSRIGRGEKAGDNSGCPIEMIYVPAPGGGFCLDRHEASVGEKCPYRDPANQPDSLANVNFSGCLPVSAKGVLPWRNISQNQAALVCAKAGKRLPTNKEWLLAALGTPDPAGNWNEDDCQVNKNWSSQPGLTGSGKNCVSAAGAFDMIGNVWEWVDGTIHNGAYRDRLLPDAGYVAGVNDDGWPSQTRPDSPDANYYQDYFWIKKIGARGVARGGYWDNNDGAGQYSIYAVAEPSFTGVGVGFRCAK